MCKIFILSHAQNYTEFCGILHPHLWNLLNEVLHPYNFAKVQNYIEIYLKMQNYEEFCIRILMQPQIANFRKVSIREITNWFRPCLNSSHGRDKNNRLVIVRVKIFRILVFLSLTSSFAIKNSTKRKLW